MRRFVALAIPVIIIVCFILIMTAGTYLKQPTGENDDVIQIIEYIKSDIDSEDWSRAETDANHLTDAWQNISRKVQFSAERDDLIKGKTSIARAKGYIEAKNKAGAFSELGEVKEHWSDIGN